MNLIYEILTKNFNEMLASLFSNIETPGIFGFLILLLMQAQQFH